MDKKWSGFLSDSRERSIPTGRVGGLHVERRGRSESISDLWQLSLSRRLPRTSYGPHRTNRSSHHHQYYRRGISKRICEADLKQVAHRAVGLPLKRRTPLPPPVRSGLQTNVGPSGGRWTIIRRSRSLNVVISDPPSYVENIGDASCLVGLRVIDGLAHSCIERGKLLEVAQALVIAERSCMPASLGD